MIMIKLIAILFAASSAHASEKIEIFKLDGTPLYHSDHKLEIKGPVTKLTAVNFQTDFLSFPHDAPYAIIKIDSRGGDVDAGMSILKDFDILRKRRTLIVCVADYQAHSIAFSILSHCDVRLATPVTAFLVHKMEIGLPCEVRKTAKQLRELADYLELSETDLRRQNAFALGVDLQTYDRISDAETTFNTEMLLNFKYLQGVVKISE